MQYFLLIMVIVLSSSQNIFQKQYNLKASKPNVFLFSTFTSLAALLFFVISSGFKLKFLAELIPYSAAFAISYSAATVGLMMAIRFGSLALTSLINSYSLIIPAMYGMIFLKEPVGVNAYAGIVLLLISLLLLNFKKENVKFSLKWVIAIIVAFVGNGMCSTTQKIQQLHFSGEYKSEFMIIALFIAALIQFIFAFREGGIKREITSCAKLAMPNGIFNGIVNLLVMILTGLLPNAILFPSISAGGIILSCLIALLIYKEKLTRIQAVGYLLGIVSVILLNL